MAETGSTTVSSQTLGIDLMMSAAGVQVVRTQRAADQSDPISQLEKLPALRKSGALTDAEFEQQKQRILGEQ